MSRKKSMRTGVKAGMVTALALSLSVSAVSSAGTYVPNNRDTKKAPEKVEYDIQTPDGYELLYETENSAFYWREDRDIIAVHDKRNGYTWKTGADIGFPSQIKDAVKKAQTDAEKKEAAEPLESNLNSTYTAIANSLLTVEYYESGTAKYYSSASEGGVSSLLYTLDGEESRRRLDVDFEALDLQVKVYITFADGSVSYDIPYEEITGSGKAVMKSLWLTPFLGASGGRASYYDEEQGDYGEDQAKYMTPGYVFVPDGSGSLIRFRDNNASFVEYIGDVYGSDLSSDSYYSTVYNNTIPFKEPVMPVFGIAHGDSQAAFVAWADSGAEYMEIIVRPEENKRILYTWAYPRFEYNMDYFQVYNKKGEGFFTMMEEPSNFDISMTYTFLAGDGSQGPAADYTGMAREYRNHLLETGVLTEQYSSDTDIPIRLDFIMADSENGLMGTEQVVVTTARDVREILEEVMADGITNINSGLKGWQKNGEVLTSPGKIRFSGAIGSEKEFKSLMQDMSEKGVDISYSREFTTINERMLHYYETAAKHVSTWYVEIDKEVLLPVNAIVTEFSYARPEKTAAWVKKLGNRTAAYSPSLTIDGMSNILVSSYGRNGVDTSLQEAAALYRETLAELPEELKINMINPNNYLWEYTDRYLQMPVNSSQYIFETDTVPFLQMVLYGTMEMYAPYSNFSFYTRSDILKMIDYNISPSFILSRQPSYYLANSNSFDLYSTEFTEYKTLISQVYSEVNSILGVTQGYAWKDRAVLEDGVILNSYEKDGEKLSVVINYTENDVAWNGTDIAALSAEIIK